MQLFFNEVFQINTATLKPKRIIFITLLVVLLTFQKSSAQSNLRAFTFSFGRWNKYLKEWIWDINQAPVNIPVILTDDSIIIKNKAQSKYYLQDVFKIDTTKKDTVTIVSWNAVDEVNLKCIVQLSYYPITHRSTVAVMYDDLFYVWEIIKD